MTPVTPTAFSRTFARLLGDRSHGMVWTIAGGLLVLAAWTAWAALVHITLYEVSSSARLELDGSAYPIQSPLTGRVGEVHLRVGQIVHAGETLIALDAEPETLQRREQLSRANGLEPALAKLAAQIAADEQARVEEQRLARLTADEAASRIAEARSAWQYAGTEQARFEKLQASGLAPNRDLDKARTETDQRRAALDTLEATARRVPQEQSARDRERDARIRGLEASIDTLASERRALLVGVDRLTYEIERRTLRAPVDGVVAEAASVRPGAVVDAGARLWSVVPAGQLLVAAQFPANAALGRIRAGQSATLRLDGFPWAEFGSVPATVVRVAQEVRDGRIRVELSIDAHSSFRGRLEHGMPGSLEVAVERLTPLALILRTAGRALTVPR